MVETILKRKITTKIKLWDEGKKDTALFVEGARQIGKTTVITNYFKAKGNVSFIKIDFSFDKNMFNLFQESKNVAEVIQTLRIYFKDKKFDKNTYIFFDEIQEYCDILNWIKPLIQETDYHFIISGSLLNINQTIKFYPVGFLTRIKMYPLDFEEFLWSQKYDENQIDEIKKQMLRFERINSALFNTMNNLFKQYLCLGGMPKVVCSFCETNSMSNVINIKKNIISDYKNDIFKIRDKKIMLKAVECFETIPAQLAKENKKFKFSLINKNARYERYVYGLNWLSNSSMINFCYNLTNLELPLKGNHKIDNFKIYFVDTGLLISMLNDESIYDSIINEDYLTYKGAIFENFMAQAINSSGCELFYYCSDKINQGKDIEIDFVIAKNKKIFPIEVKSGKTISSSLNYILEKNQKMIGLKFCKNNVGYQNNLYTLPHFYILVLEEILSGLFVD